MNDIQPLRLLLKAALLFVLANVIFALWNPPVGRISAYNLVFPGRTRLPFGAGLAEANISVDNLDAMFASHVISAPKGPDEFRVVVLGDSSIWGELLYADQTLPARLNDLQLACPGKSLRFYNLGYPHPSVVKDLLFLDKALEYKPDMVIWTMTALSLNQKPPNVFLLENFKRVLALAERYDLRYEYWHLNPEEKTFLEKTLIGQRNQLSQLLLLQSMGTIWGATGMDIAPLDGYEELSNNQKKELGFATFKEPTNLEPFLMLDYLSAGAQVGGKIPVLYVNEPIFIAAGRNSDVRYNSMYPRWAYDQYRQILSKQASAADWLYLDLWNVIPPEHFSDNPLHLSAEGEQLLAESLQPIIQKAACP